MKFLRFTNALLLACALAFSAWGQSGSKPPEKPAPKPPPPSIPAPPPKNPKPPGKPDSYFSPTTSQFLYGSAITAKQ